MVNTHCQKQKKKQNKTKMEKSAICLSEFNKTFLYGVQIVSISAFVGHAISVTATQLWPCRMKAAIADM